jgi:hypothetical protein
MIIRSAGRRDGHYVTPLRHPKTFSVKFLLADQEEIESFQTSLFVDELSVTLSDDCCDVSNNQDEYVRVTLDGVAFG